MHTHKAPLLSLSSFVCFSYMHACIYLSISLSVLSRSTRLAARIAGGEECGGRGHVPSGDLLELIDGLLARVQLSPDLPRGVARHLETKRVKGGCQRRGL